MRRIVNLNKEIALIKMSCKRNYLIGSPLSRGILTSVQNEVTETFTTEVR